ncbi:hypothetical protein HD554DRAFT_2133358 [Boletus coccyginus]|nr:hypothetical protein HD554DRAFT_2133358 [Boletus coccyginus]
MAITKLVGDRFLSCWWDTAKCHLALWKNGVHHRDISASNLMYKVEGSLVVGVLIDFDLATIVDSVTGNERTGTVPFMALDLLSKEVLAGKIEHIYAYDAESFIWVLVWICLRYDDGELRKDDRPLDEWLKVDALGCGEKKLYFLNYIPQTLTAGRGHERNWLVAKKHLNALVLYKAKKQILSETSDATCEGPFQALLAKPDRSDAAEEQ